MSLCHAHTFYWNIGRWLRKNAVTHREIPVVEEYWLKRVNHIFNRLLSKANLINKTANEKCVTLGFGFMVDYVPAVVPVDFWSLLDELFNLFPISDSCCIIP